ncbi:MAG: hypothetical protein LBF37_03750 [Rickettsiales bacterium]|nr:hypothetical protein [Rickettsiales bacterium]
MSYKTMKNFTKIFVLVAAVLSAGSAHAWPLVTLYRSAWGVDFTTWDAFPIGSNHANFCVANSMNSSGGCQKRMGIHGDDEAVVGLVAWTLADNGAYFCVTQFQCEGKKKSWTWNLPPQGTQKCFWLCKNGYSGNGCLPINESEYVLTTGSPACAQAEIARSDFSGNNVRSAGNTGLNQENSIHLLHSRYGGNQEMDVMVGVSGWLENKKGVIASPFLFYCANKDDSNTMDVNFYPNYASETLCLPGYTGPNCDRCKAASMCPGYNVSQFSADSHTMAMKSGCSMFTCSDTSKGFKSSTERDKCVDCSGPRAYVNSDGVCSSCGEGQLYSKQTNKCETATILSAPEMRYGEGKTSEPANPLDACWVQVDPAQYLDCVRYKGTATWKSALVTGTVKINLEKEACLMMGGTWTSSCVCPNGKTWKYSASSGGRCS